MELFQIRDKSTGDVHEIPYHDLQAALQGGGEFVNDSDVDRATAIQNPSFGRKVLNYEKGLGLGLLQGAGDTAASIGNFVGSGVNLGASGLEKLSGQQLKRVPHIPHPNLKQYYPEGEGSDIGAGIGEFIGGAVAPVGGFAKTGMGAISKIPGAKGYASKILEGSLKGVGLGAASNEEDRLGGGLAGLLLGGASKSIPNLNKLPAITKKGIAQEVLNKRNQVKQNYNKIYNNLFARAENEGHFSMNAPKANKDLIYENIPDKYNEKLKQFYENPNAKTAHEAQSDLGKAERAIEKREASLGITKHERDVLREVKSLKEKIQKGIFNGSDRLKKSYQDVTKGYAKDVVPYTTNKAINQLSRGEIFPEQLSSRLSKSAPFINAAGKEHPGIKINEMMNSALGKKLLYGMLTGAGIGGGWKISH